MPCGLDRNLATTSEIEKKKVSEVTYVGMCDIDTAIYIIYITSCVHNNLRLISKAIELTSVSLFTNVASGFMNPMEINTDDNTAWKIQSPSPGTLRSTKNCESFLLLSDDAVLVSLLLLEVV